MSYRYNWTTAHTLTADVQNPHHVFRDKRTRPHWYDQPIIPKGSRLLVSYTDCDAPERSVFRVVVSSDTSDGTAPSASRWSRDDGILIGFAELDGDAMRFIPYGEKYLRHADTRKEKDRIAALDTFAANLNKALSQPLRDFGSVFLPTLADDENGGHDTLRPEDVLYQLYLDGRLSLDEVERFGTDALARQASEYEAKRHADKEREVSEEVAKHKESP